MRHGYIVMIYDAQGRLHAKILDTSNDDQYTYTSPDIFIETFPNKKPRPGDHVWFRPMPQGGIGNIIFRGRTGWLDRVAQFIRANLSR